MAKPPPSIWVIDNQQVVHYANCDELVLRPTPYVTTPKTATEMVEHVGRNDVDKNGNIAGAPNLLSACQCVTLTAERESK